MVTSAHPLGDISMGGSGSFPWLQSSCIKCLLPFNPGFIEVSEDAAFKDTTSSNHHCLILPCIKTV